MLRFAAQLGFHIEQETLHAAVMLAPRLNDIAVERIRDEVEKILLSANPDILGLAILSGFLIRFGLSEKSRLRGLKNVARTKLARWAAFCMLSAQNADMLRLFKLDKKTVRAVEKAFVILKSGLPEDEASLKRLCRRMGVDAVIAAAAMQDAKCGGKNGRRLSQMLEKGECFTSDTLAIGGDDLIKMGFQKGKDIGRVINALVEHVIDNPKDNNYEKLLKLVVAIKDK